jgi:hypothetical protein
MTRALLPGSRLNAISGSLDRYPTFQVLVYDPNCVTINEVATDSVPPTLDISDFVESITYNENIGFENGDDPSTTSATITFSRHPDAGKFRRGMIEDGVIVQIRQGDVRIRRDEWLPIFTGTFRGRPGDDPGTRSGPRQGLQATAFGREERYLNLSVTSRLFKKGTDVGEAAAAIAQRHMEMGQDEILFGNQGFTMKHSTNQLVEINALQALWELAFTVFKKPKFDNRGRLVFVDVKLDKPAARVYSAGDLVIESRVADPNDVEVANDVVITGLSDTMTKITQGRQILTEFEIVTGFFDTNFKERKYYSLDRSQRAEDTALETLHRIKWSDAAWAEVDEFHGIVDIDTRFLRNARVIIFITYLATQIAVATLDLAMDEGGQAVANTPTPSPAGGITTIAILRFILEVLALGALALLLWAMQFIGRGSYQVTGIPFEFVFQELISEAKLVGLKIEQERKAEFRNDFLSTMTDLDAHSKERLKRELVKNQLFTITLLDDLLLEVDDVIEDSAGNRFYIVTVTKELRRGARPTMTIIAWKVFDAVGATAEAVSIRKDLGA